MNEESSNYAGLEVNNNAGGNSASENDNKEKYLVFRVGNELFGVPLLGVREVLEPQRIKTIPNTVDSFLGVMNIRGEIIGVVDLRVRLGQKIQASPFLAMIIFECETGATAAIVDKVESVSIIPEESIDTSPNVASHFQLKYLKGIGKLSDGLVTLINLNDVLTEEVINHLGRSKLKAA